MDADEQVLWHNPRVMKQIVVVAGGLAIALVTMLQARAQSSSGPWVGTWSTSVVGRPQTPPAPLPPGPPPFMANECPVTAAPPPIAPPPGQTFAPQPFVHVTNQTLRQIVHTSIGGDRVRAWCSATRSAPRR